MGVGELFDRLGGKKLVLLLCQTFRYISFRGMEKIRLELEDLAGNPFLSLFPSAILHVSSQTLSTRSSVS